MDITYKTITIRELTQGYSDNGEGGYINEKEATIDLYEWRLPHLHFIKKWGYSPHMAKIINNKSGDYKWCMQKRCIH